MGVGGQTGRFGGAGYDTELAALLAVDVDLGALDKGLGEARRRTGQSLNQMADDTRRWERNSRFAYQNVAFQVQDFAVQVAGGQGAIRALAQNLPQLLGGFGLFGAAAGAAVAITGGLIQVWVEGGETAAELGERVDELGDRLEALAERYAAATGAARDFAGAQLEAVAQSELPDLLEQQQEALAAYRSALEALQTRRGGLDPEIIGSIQRLATGLESGEITAIQFRREIEAIAQALPEFQGDRVRDVAEALIEAATNAQRLQESIAEVSAGIRIGGLEDLRKQVVDLRNELVVAELPEELRDMAEAAAELGVDLSAGGLERLPPAAREALNEIAALTQQVEAAEEAHDAAETAAKRQADALKDLRAQTASLRAQTEATQRGGLFGGEEAAAQVKDLAQAAERFGFTIDTLAEAPPIIRETVQQFVEEKAALREVEAAHEGVLKALRKRNQEAVKALEAQRKAEDDLLRDRQRENSQRLERREGRIESSGRLPDDIDAANIAAQELSTTLSDLNNLTFDGLLSSLVSIGQRLAEQIIQALIFQAIMSALGFATGGGSVAVAGLAGASTGPGFGGATVTPIPGRATGGPAAAHRAIVTGEFGRELFVPNTAGVVVPNGQLEAMTGGGRGAGDVYNLHAQRIDPGTVSFLLNQARGQVTPTVVNARARGQIQDRTSF